MTDVAHLTDPGFEPGDTIQTLCGIEHTARADVETRPICRGCHDAQMNILFDHLDYLYTVIEDRGARIYDILVALDELDHLGQKSWLNQTTEQMISNAVYRPGPGKPEGPSKEDGTF